MSQKTPFGNITYTLNADNHKLYRPKVLITSSDLREGSYLQKISFGPDPGHSDQQLILLELAEGTGPQMPEPRITPQALIPCLQWNLDSAFVITEADMNGFTSLAIAVDTGDTTKTVVVNYEDAEVDVDVLVEG